MFNNANVLFKTKFVDGVSTVTRYAQQQPTRAAPSSSAASKGGAAAKNKGTKRARRDAGDADFEVS